VTPVSGDGNTAEPDQADEQPPLAVIDVDGVVADVRHRLHHIEGRPRDWRAFFAAAGEDPPLADGIELAKELGREHEVIWLSGRPRRLAGVTKRWLASHGLPAGRLVLRANGDFRPAAVLKAAELRKAAAGRRVAVVVDDDPAVVAALRAEGWPVKLADWVRRDDALDTAQEREGRT
jgi:hypothetical protein